MDVMKWIYNGSMIKFVMESIMTGWCKSDAGVRLAGMPPPPISTIIHHICERTRFENSSM